MHIEQTNLNFNLSDTFVHILLIHRIYIMAQQLRNVVARGMGPVGKFVLGAGAAGTFLYNGLYNVEGGHRAVIFNRITGVKEGVIDEERTLPSRGLSGLLFTTSAPVRGT